jgi:hypothetical protein
MTLSISHRKKEPAASKRMVCPCGMVSVRDSSAGPVCQRCSDIEHRMAYDYHVNEGRRNNHGGAREGSGRVEDKA